MTELKTFLKKCVEKTKNFKNGISQMIKTEYIKKALAVFCIMLVSFGILYVYGQKNDGNKLRDTEEKNEENIFKLNMPKNARHELTKGISSIYVAVTDRHLESAYSKIMSKYLPFGRDIYLVLSNQKDGNPTVVENQSNMVMAAQQDAGQNTEMQQAQEAQKVLELQEAQKVLELEEAQKVLELQAAQEAEQAAMQVAQPETQVVYTEPETKEEVLFTIYDPNFATESVDAQASVSDNVTRDVSSTPVYTKAFGNITSDEYYWLRQIVQAEAGNQDEVGKILVANVILNRVRNGRFPGNIKDVIFQGNGRVYQFQPVKNGMINTVVPDQNTIACVDRALAGEDYSDGALFFARQTANDSWFNRSLTFLFVHGAHYFYKY